MPPSFHAVATRSDRVRVVFSEPMLNNANLVSTARYVLSPLGGGVVSIGSIVTEQSSNVRSTVLLLGAPLLVGRLYRLRITLVVSQGGVGLSPDVDIFQWAGGALSTTIPIEHFSGEAEGGLYGEHDGLVFFSPALESAAVDSTIQVEQVDACSKAFDRYQMPASTGMQNVLRTHGAGLVPTPLPTTLNSTAVLSNSPRVEARFALGAHLLETVVPLVDGPATATLVESWPMNRVALLNNSTWKLFQPGTPEPFTTADNLTAFPVSPPVIIPL